MVFNGFIHITPRSIWRWLFLPYKSIMAYILVLRNLNQRDIVQNDKCRSSMLLNCHQMYFSFTQASHSQHFCHGCRHLTWQNSELQPQNCLKYGCAYFQPNESIVWDGGWRKSQISHFLLVLVQDMPYDFLWYCTHPKLFWIWSINTRYVHFHLSFQELAEQSVQVAAEVKASHQFFQCRHCCLILANVFIYENSAIIYLDFNQVPIVLVN